MVVRRRKCRRIRCAKGSVVLIKTRAEAMSREPRSRTFQGGVTENVPTFATHETEILGSPAPLCSTAQRLSG